MVLHIFIGEKEIDSLSEKIESIEDLQNILTKVSNVYPCKEVGNKTCAQLYIGYVTRDCSVRGVKRERCISCAKHYKKKLKILNRPTRLKKLSRTGETRARCKNIVRKNVRLRKKVNFPNMYYCIFCTLLLLT
ncbi:uncharacterized protein LOC105285490 [Ooceraea biroi]|uniref:uncharacterized protein LOC105285490 n=1 Tax=Ooceraea biroi TaxID=2015173 RepID=UPI0009716B97|nr:uncharacterized protein LOC105285490 [Ooceraea biroi]